ncbi:MAG TPA: TIGR03560 family F420-dependent LLM class oxidoreductase [Candidatus Limnocylindria bacterium]|nr:TIGR03560 family F420-dependent LLM class oxidoreductase [Candidatus Limnocylindria bacterium]
MNVGVIVPQGWTGEYAGWDAAEAWERTVAIAHEAERLGFESLWAFDHMHTTPEPTDEITFESHTVLSALARETRRVRLGHIVACAGYRNPALLAKMVSTLDVVSGGRAELGIGAGWKHDEWQAYGYGFPDTSERLEVLRDALEVTTRMFGHGRATYHGQHASVDGAINEPASHNGSAIPIMVGGNGRKVTWRLAARFADELNLDAMTPEDVRDAMPVIKARCEEIGRDPRSLRVSVHVWWEHMPSDEERMAELLRAFWDQGVFRIQTLPRAAVDDPQALERLASAAARAAAPPEVAA